ncbi:hypothetical protein F7734_35255 [Scytonema sp. UIC 10036]|uniref:hypothetical protein n=1 Tax=Scytonema sp. UIC 10036 TaxID=2304196 RepID=UPI0012DA688E|nr:hypothetical protein [Scytonema sp. UIC 10036]MUG97306.1 hypothetical protein [Scytonema sp. UIC 10036]
MTNQEELWHIYCTSSASLAKEKSVGGSMTTVNHLLFALQLLTALGCGLVAGVFFAFSTFVFTNLAL